MNAEARHIEVANRFGRNLEHAAMTGDWTGVYPHLASDVEWITPKRTLHGIDEVEHDLTWGSPPDHLDVAFQIGPWRDLGENRAMVDVHEIYRLRGTGELAYERDRRIRVTISDGKVMRYEMEVVG
jgi:hypothetical protein